MSHAAAEIASQPDVWEQAVALSAETRQGPARPIDGERVALVGCGTSLYVAQACAALREQGGHGETDAFAASEYPRSRSYDRVVAITRSGTTTEVDELLRALPRSCGSVVVTTDLAHPVVDAARHAVVLDFADEQSVVQTRFATSVLAWWRALYTGDVGSAVRDARAVLAAELDPDLLCRTQFTFLGSGWSVGLASEAALKLRETSQSWAEAYPAMEFRHGPISVVDDRSAVIALGPLPPGLDGEILATGAALVRGDSLDPMAQLVRAQRLAVALAEARGLDPDHPRHLTRSVVLEPAR